MNRLIRITCGVIAFAWISTQAVSQNNVPVHGTVKSDTGEPLSGVSILVKGTAQGTITDGEGNYTLQLAEENPVLVFSFQGYKRQEIKVSGSGNVNVTLVTDLKELDEVVFTATRSAKPLEKVPQKIRVIDRNEIDKTIAADLTDLVKKTAGVDVIQYPGMLSGVGIRGFRPQFSGINQRTLLLIDGRPAGATNLATIDMNNVERVEVLKGPASALYGSQAMGGVINIITKKTNGDVSGKVYAGIGSFGIADGGFSVGGSLIKNLDFDASFNSHTQAKDFKLGDNNVFRNAFDWKKADRILWTETGKENVKIDDVRGDGTTRLYTNYNNYSGGVRLGYSINNNWRVDIKGDRFNAKNVNTPGDIEDGNMTPGLKDLDRYGSDIIAKGSITPTLELTAKAFSAKEKSKNYSVTVTSGSAIRSEYVRSTNEITWGGGQLMARKKLNAHAITAGIDYTRTEQENFSFTNTGAQQNVSVKSPNFHQQNTGIYIQGDLNFLDDKLNVTAGARSEFIQYDINGTDLFPSRTQSTSVVNPSVGVNYNFAPGFYAHATFGTGFTTVGIFEIAGYSETNVDKNKTDGVDTVDVFTGNPDLKNQSSQTVDVGLRYANKKGVSIDMTYFNTRFDNNVVSSVTQYPGTLAESGAVIRNRNSYKNAKGTTLTGIEFDASYDFGEAAEENYSLKVFAGGTCIIKAEEIREVYLQPAPLTLAMQNVADLTVNYGIGYDNLKWFSAKLSGRYVGKRYDTDWSYYLSPDNGYGAGNYADIRYPSFMVLDLATSVRKDRHEVSLMIGNLTDENYYEKRGFNMMGRNFLLKYTLHL